MRANLEAAKRDLAQGSMARALAASGGDADDMQVCGAASGSCCFGLLMCVTADERKAGEDAG